MVVSEDPKLYKIFTQMNNQTAASLKKTILEFLQPQGNIPTTLYTTFYHYTEIRYNLYIQQVPVLTSK